MGKRTNNRANSSSSKKRAAGQKHSQVLINEQSTEELISDKNVESEEIEIEENDEPEVEEIATVAVEMEQDRDEPKSVQPSPHPPTSPIVVVAGPSQSSPMEQNDGWNLVRGKNFVTNRSQQDVNDELHNTSIAGFNKEVGTPIHTNNSFVLEGHVGCLEQAPRPPFVIGVNQRPKRSSLVDFVTIRDIMLSGIRKEALLDEVMRDNGWMLLLPAPVNVRIKKAWQVVQGCNIIRDEANHVMWGL
ncbi:hypothetical protein ACFE04_025712 [Oxalis oulophora]